jgi:peptide/nickel transport system substrate-binding protein
LRLLAAVIRYWSGALVAVVFLVGAGTAAAARPVTGAVLFRLDLDPQVAWSNFSENVIEDTYIPLLTYRHAGGKAGSEVIPGLARSLPRITDGGRTYTLRLRKGLRYSDGEPVRASDFKFAVERMFGIARGGRFYGPESFYLDIVGARRFEWTGRGGISGISADDRTGRIVVHLVRPERSFTRKLAMTWAAPVPPGTPMSNRSLDPPPATGPYVITDSTRRGWTYERNPEWASRNGRLIPGLPSGHLDTIKIKVVRKGAQAIREVERGKLDWVSEEMTGPGYLALRHRSPSRVRLEPTLGVEYFWLNTSKPPFDDVRVRRAVNYAVDRTIFSRLSGGQMSPTQQILPPDLPGYRKSTLYPHDMAKARRLIAAADPSVRKITLWTYGERGRPMQIEYAAYLGAVLDELGFTVDLRALGTERYFSLIGTARHPHLDAGISGWYANYPDPDDFFRNTIGSRVTAYYNENHAQLIAPSLSRTIDRLETRSASTMPEADYAALDQAYMRLAPWVPIGSISVPLFVSSRIDLAKAVSNPMFGVDLASLRLR